MAFSGQRDNQEVVGALPAPVTKIRYEEDSNPPTWGVGNTECNLRVSDHQKSETEFIRGS